MSEMKPDPVRAVQQGVIDAVLARFGWKADDEFRRRYWTDPWIYNLTNALVALAEENENLRATLEGGPGVRCPYCSKIQPPGQHWCPGFFREGSDERRP